MSMFSGGDRKELREEKESGILVDFVLHYQGMKDLDWI